MTRETSRTRRRADRKMSGVKGLNMAVEGQGRARERPAGERVVRSVTWSAGPGCHGGCGVLVHLQGDTIQKIEDSAPMLAALN